LRNRIVLAVMGRLAAWLLRAVGSTWRIEFEGAKPPGPGDAPVLGAFWHQNILTAAFVFRDRQYCAPVSRSRDGDLIAAALGQLGYAASPRGSSSRGGAAVLRAMVRMVKSGTTVSISTDGPRGPARKSKPGIVALARLSQAPIVPVGFSATPCLRLRSWDRMCLPLPFARVRCVVAPRIQVSRTVDSGAEVAVRLELDRELDRLTAEMNVRSRLEDAGAGGA
jgi:lysophospholipid acyltransferase (LPLAT)-like uncharacterized protein